MPARLVSLCGRPTISLTKTLTLVGRQQCCDVRIGSARISRCHCCLVIENGEVVVRDLNSTNGTQVNGRSIVSDRLRHGDVLTIGHLAYRVCLEELGGDGPVSLPEDPSIVEPGHELSTALELVPPAMDPTIAPPASLDA